MTKHKKEELINRMVAIYGLEHPIVIAFCDLINRIDVRVLETLVKSHEEFPFHYYD